MFALCFLQVLVYSVFLHHIFFNSENLRRLLHQITKIIKFTHEKNNVGSSKKKESLNNERVGRGRLLGRGRLWGTRRRLLGRARL